MKHRSIADRINRENEIRLWGPLLIPFAFMLLLFIVTATVIKYSEQIDKFCSKHPVLVGWSCVVFSLIGIIWWTYRRTKWTYK